ncbi:hypothetical protein [Cellulomonas rhizosphaerae]|uniref:Uncharacterized protein n=1 Tax=Cellulomonas rhizosphaerae TaxID=2293719 RepID=A0A413RPK6_9CELL|nr:hypothetical protein [Cellulomonas rhizosphaerae]RHA43932.1 hypothetical protein D1825_03835 [Cellulomonas rhizosphaerae]
MTIDLHDLLHSAADGVDSTPGVAGLTARIRRRRAIRAGAVGTGALAVAGALVVAGIHAVPSHRSAPPAAPAPMPTAVVGADPGQCGWEIGAPSATGATVDSSNEKYQLAVQTAPPSSALTGSLEVTTAIVARSGEFDLTASNVTRLASRGGVVVAVWGDAGGGRVRSDHQVGGYDLVGTEVVSCGASAVPLADGAYQIWALQTVDDGTGPVTLLGGGETVDFVGGKQAATCGADVSTLPASDPSADFTARIDYPSLEPEIYGDVADDEHLGATTSFALIGSRTLEGSYSARIYLADASGKIVVDGADPVRGQAVDIAMIGDATGGEGATSPQRDVLCSDGSPLPPGTYRSFVVMTVDPFDGPAGTTSLVAEAGDVVVPAS